MQGNSIILEYKLPRDVFPRARDMVLSRLGYSTPDGLDPDISDMVDRAIKHVISTARPRGIYRVLPVEKLSKKGIVTEAGIVESSMFKQLARLSKDEKYLVFIITTLGLGLDDLHNKDDSLT